MVAVCLVFWSLSLSKEISCTTAYIYSQKDHQSTFAPSELGFPCVSFFHFLPLSLQLILWSIETCRAHSPALASKTPLERAPCAFVSNESPVSRSLLVFCINQGILAFFSLSLSYRQLQTTRFQSITGSQLHTITISHLNYFKFLNWSFNILCA